MNNLDQRAKSAENVTILLSNWCSCVCFCGFILAELVPLTLNLYVDFVVLCKALANSLRNLPLGEVYDNNITCVEYITAVDCLPATSLSSGLALIVDWNSYSVHNAHCLVPRLTHTRAHVYRLLIKKFNMCANNYPSLFLCVY